MTQSKIDPLTYELWNTMEDMDLSIELSSKIVKTIIASKDEDKTTEDMTKILKTSQNEQEIEERVKKYYQDIKEKD